MRELRLSPGFKDLCSYFKALCLCFRCSGAAYSRGMQRAWGLSHHGGVLQRGDWHLRPRYIIHMVCSVPEKSLVTTGEYCNEETGTCDPGMWIIWSAVYQRNASSPRGNIAMRRLALATQVSDPSMWSAVCQNNALLPWKRMQWRDWHF